MSVTKARLRAVATAITICALVGVAPLAGAGGKNPYDPKVDPANFVGTIDNPYFPLVPGTRWVYEGDTDEGHERVETEVMYETKQILGITATVVRDRAFVDGELVEDTFDWFAQDRAGNVWYLGEATQEYENGKPTTAKGSWEAGVEGARPGVIMPAQPRPGRSYRQEYLKGEAEDEATILKVDAKGSVPYGSFRSAVKTKDYTRLEPKLLEHKWYAPLVGLVQENTVRGGSGRLELVEFAPPTS
jgi:hypothetical protein